MLAVCILTKNCASTLAATLFSVQGLDEVIVLDNGSTDATLEIARKYPNVRVHSTVFKGFGALRNEAALLAQHDWILQLDSDEVLSPPLLREIELLRLEKSCVYKIPRHNFYNGKRIRGCGWGKDAVLRLYHKKACSYPLLAVHEALDSGTLQVLSLRHPIWHTPYRSTSDFLAKMELYSTLFAQEKRGKKHSSTWIALGHAAFAFLKGYVLQGGFFSGAEGFIIAHYNATTAFYKYQKLAEFNEVL